MNRVLVCGGRDYDDWDQLNQHLTEVYQHELPEGHKMVIIQGGAKGADFLAKVWAKFRHLPQEEFKAEVAKYGSPKAFFIRNQQMIDEGNPDLVVAFPGGTGTADMIRRAEKANIKVIKVSEI